MEGTIQLVLPLVAIAGLGYVTARWRYVSESAVEGMTQFVLVIAVLVFILSNRLRAREFESLANIGADPGSVRLLVAFEAIFVFTVSAAVAGGLLMLLDLTVPRLLPLLTS